jgi:tetratricopeptide (TPR) repeat protein
MFESIAKLREDKNRKRAADLIEKGISFVDNKLFKQAMIAFNESIEIAPDFVSIRLREQFYDYNKSGNEEGALSVGLCLIKILPDDYVLANQLGNCARRLGNYKQANNLYRHALKSNSAFREAYYNLAASMGRVDKYDQEIEGVVQPFLALKDYVLPEYIGGQEAIDKLKEELMEQRAERLEIRIQELTLQKELKEGENDPVGAAEIQEQIDKLLAADPITNADLIERLGHDITPQLQNLTPDNRSLVSGMLFNLVILALLDHNTKDAQNGLFTLNELKSDLKYIELLQAILYDFKGQTKKGIDILIKQLGKNKSNRYYNVNIGLMYKKVGNRLLALKYLLIGAVLLERSNGLYHLSELIQLAHQHFDSGAFKKALKLYRVIMMESNDIQVMLNMGEIYIAGGKFNEAAQILKKVLSRDPENQHATEKINWIHDHFCHLGEEFFAKSVFQTAAMKYEHALQICRKPETLKRTAEIYQVLKQQKKADELLAEYKSIIDAEKQREKEKIRQSYIVKGKAFMKAKNYNRAIENFELAFRMKVDKDVFMFLATLYKSLKRTAEMENLLKRWNKMVEYEEKMEKFRKDEERKKSAGE